MSVSWEEYVDPPFSDASTGDLNDLESFLGVSFPQEYKNFVVSNQGKYPSKETVVSGELSSSSFGPVFHVLDECTKEQELYSVRKKWEKWKDVYEGLIPIADSAGSGCFFAYDYRNCEENPPVVFVDVEEDPDDEDSVLFVADSLSEVIASLTS